MGCPSRLVRNRCRDRTSIETPRRPWEFGRIYDMRLERELLERKSPERDIGHCVKGIP
jgi:hypothetical protein